MAKFTSLSYTKNFERDIMDAILEEVDELSEEILSEYIGELIDAICPGCEHPEMEVIPGGKARCPMCGYTDNVQLEVDWG